MRTIILLLALAFLLHGWMGHRRQSNAAALLPEEPATSASNRVDFERRNQTDISNRPTTTPARDPQKAFRITREGDDELDDWLRTPPDLGAAARRARHQGAGRPAPCPASTYRADPGPPARPHGTDAALHAREGVMRTTPTSAWRWWPTPSCSGWTPSSDGSTPPTPG